MNTLFVTPDMPKFNIFNLSYLCLLDLDKYISNVRNLFLVLSFIREIPASDPGLRSLKCRIYGTPGMNGLKYGCLGQVQIRYYRIVTGNIFMTF